MTKVQVFVASGRAESTLIKNTLAKDPTKAEEEALRQIYALLRPGDAPNRETAKQALERLFFSPKRYDLGRVGRYKINQRLHLKTPMSTTVLTKDDFVDIMKNLVELHEGRGDVDDIDQLGNRRIRSVGELIANQFSVGLSRMARLVKERMSINTDPEKISLDDLVNARTVSAVIQAFFGSSQLSQFMDQTNPLAELTHKRRLSALGPGGLTRERAGFEVRDVHYSQYGRMCPIETPEGPNIGLITSLACFARVNDLGFIETPYRVVKEGRVTNDIVWLDANREEDAIIAQANSKLHPDGTFVDEYVLSRKRGDLPQAQSARHRLHGRRAGTARVHRRRAHSVPRARRRQSRAHGIEHAAPGRAAAQPAHAVRRHRPRGHGGRRLGRGHHRAPCRRRHERHGRRDHRRRRPRRRAASRAIVRSRGSRSSIATSSRSTGAPTRTRPSTSVRWCACSQKVAKGEVLADGAATEMGQLALGRNVTVAFMPWYGHNFEDAIVLSERLVKDDVFSSIHIQELELHVRDTKRGQEEITREIPNVAEESLVDLDERGIVRIGAQVKPGDILVGKITPKGETELSPEEKLLTAIFGEKAKDVKDSSLKVSPGMEGVVIDVKIFSRVEDQVVEKDRGERIGEVRRQEGEEKIRVNEVRDMRTGLAARRRDGVARAQGGHGRGSDSRRHDAHEGDAGRACASRRSTSRRSASRTSARTSACARSSMPANEEKARIEERAEERIDRILQPDELPPGVIQLVKVYLAEKRKISVGDKMAGRHGNKGIVARIVPEEDMPFMPDGRPVDIVLNPLGVPSRMNVGQILETHLGWAAKLLNFYAKTPVFQGANEREIGLLMKLAGLRYARETLSLGDAASDATPQDVRNLLADVRPDRTAPDKVELLHGCKPQRPERRSRCRRRRRRWCTRARVPHECGADARAARARRGERVARMHRSGETNCRATARTPSRSSRRRLRIGPAETLQRMGLPALAAMLGAEGRRRMWMRRHRADASLRPHAGGQGAPARRPYRRDVHRAGHGR